MENLVEALKKSMIEKLEKHTTDFLEYCKEFIYDNLYKFENKTVYSSDLGIELTNDINKTGSITYNRYKAEKILKSWSDYYDWYINKMKSYEYQEYEYLGVDEETGKVELDIYSHPETTMVRFVIFGVDDILSQCKTLDTNKITLTYDVIEQLKDEIKKVKNIR